MTQMKSYYKLSGESLPDVSPNQVLTREGLWLDLDLEQPDVAGSY